MAEDGVKLCFERKRKHTRDVGGKNQVEGTDLKARGEGEL